MITAIPSDQPQKLAYPFDRQGPFALDCPEEVARLQRVERCLYEAMRGPFPAGVRMQRARRVLDVGCDAGCWARSLAAQYASVQAVVVDERPSVLELAYTEPQERVSYACVPLQELAEHFAPASFGLINLRFHASRLLPEQFPTLLANLARLTRSWGYLVWTEAEFPITNSPSCARLHELIVQALQCAGRAFVPDMHLGITAHMTHWLAAAGYRVETEQGGSVDISASTRERQTFLEQVWVLRQPLTALLAQTQVSSMDAFAELWRAVLHEMSASTFRGVCPLRTVVGMKLPDLDRKQF